VWTVVVLRWDAAARRALRAAIVIPALFAFAAEVIGDPNVSTFASIGAFAMLLLADFGGPVRSRLGAYACLALAGSALVALGTLCSRVTWLSFVVAGVVGAAVLFAGILSGYAAKGSTAALLVLVLPLTIPADPAAIGPRLEGWALACVVGTLAALVLWPDPPQAGIAPLAAHSLDALADDLDAQLAGDPPGRAGAAEESVARTRAAYLATANPMGATAGDQSLVALVQDLDWLLGLTSDAGDLPPDGYARAAGEDRALVAAASGALRAGAAALRDGPDGANGPGGARGPDGGSGPGGASTHDRTTAGPATPLPAPGLALAHLADARVLASDASSARVHRWSTGGDTLETDELECTYHARAVATASASAAGAALSAAAALAPRSAGRNTAVASRSRRAEIAVQSLAHVDLRSVWLRNSLRGALGFALAVLVAKVTNVQHGFWVVLGTLAVLRSNALGTGATALRALAGTTLGFVAGAALLVALGDHVDALWVVLPIAVALAGYAPVRISFLAGQAAFTVLLAVLFNIIQPTGWRVGLVRVEDVAIGCAISLGVGILLWPRGVAPVVSVDLADAYRTSSDYLSSAVHELLGRQVPRRTEDAAADAGAAARRLDAALRGYLAEQGPKAANRSELVTLAAGSNRLLLTAASLATLGVRGPAGGSDGDAVDRELHELALAVGRIADGLSPPSARDLRRIATAEELHSGAPSGVAPPTGATKEPAGAAAGAGADAVPGVARAAAAAGVVCVGWIHHHLGHLIESIGPIAAAAAAVPTTARRPPWVAVPNRLAALSRRV